MRYVMVPVPSEFVLDIMRMIVFRSPEEEDEGAATRDEARIRHLLEHTDDRTRELLHLVARSTATGGELRFSDAAEELEVDGDTLSRLLREANALVFGPSRELVGVTEEIAVRVHGNVGKNRYLVMRPEHAKVIRRIAGADASLPG